jgi:Ca2+/Na+ antiporter
VLLRRARFLDRRVDPGVLGGTVAVFGTVLAAVTAAAITAHRPEGAASEAAGSHFFHLVLVGGGFLGFGIYALLVQLRNHETSQGSRDRGSSRGPDGRKRSLPDA